MAEEPIPCDHCSGTGKCPRCHGTAAKLGATGNFPSGMPLRPGDEGHLQAALWWDNRTKRIMLDFFKALEWVAMTPSEALAFADALKAEVRKHS
jgi:hypothetical protein